MIDCWTVLELLKEPLPTAVIGLGKRGLKHISVLERCPATALVGLCDSRPEALAPFSGAVHTSTDAERLLSEVGPSAAVVAVSHDAYMPLIGHCLAKGVSCLKEKPLARSLSEARQLERLAAGAEGKLAIAAQRRHGDMLSAIRAVMAAKGRPPIAFQYVYTLGLTPSGRDWRDSRDLAGGGAILDMGYHVIDLLTALLGVPQCVSAFDQRPGGSADGYVENGATLLLSYPAGTSGTVIISRHLSPEAERATFWFEDETVEFDGQRVTSVRDGERVWLADMQSSEELIHRQLHAFLRLHSGEPNMSCDVASSLESMRAIELCYQALESDGIAHTRPEAPEPSWRTRSTPAASALAPVREGGFSQ
ncbi:Gfo/Idh/MocA family oxidoreductase [Streptomyces canus]|uniref:Gfo/Idh/MocA family protein n=1 Tax=Streptomyces canus TaxID=58343 RepID=UPI0030E49FAA